VCLWFNQALATALASTGLDLFLSARFFDLILIIVHVVLQVITHDPDRDKLQQ